VIDLEEFNNMNLLYSMAQSSK